MIDLLPLAERAGARLKQRHETITVAESSAGGLISAALLAVPGASAYFLGGAVVYTRLARAELLRVPEIALAGMRPSTEPYALLLARSAREPRVDDRTATQQATPASRWSARWNARSRWKPGAPTVWRTCAHSRAPRSSC